MSEVYIFTKTVTLVLLVPYFTIRFIAQASSRPYNCQSNINLEGSHSGLVRAPAKRLGGESSLMGSNPIPSANLSVYLSGFSEICSGLF